MAALAENGEFQRLAALEPNQTVGAARFGEAVDGARLVLGHTDLKVPRRTDPKGYVLAACKHVDARRFFPPRTPTWIPAQAGIHR